MGNEARRVRCFNCGAVWTEHPAGGRLAPRALPPRRLAATARVASALMEATAETRASRAAAPSPMAKPMTPPRPRAEPKAEPPPAPAPKPKAAPKPPPPPPEPQPDLDEDADPDLVLGGDGPAGGPSSMAMDQPDRQPEPSLSDEELDAMLGPEHEFEPMKSLVEQPSERADDDNDALDMADVKPFPEVFTAADLNDRRRRRSGGGLKIAAIALLTLILVAVAGLFFGRTLIAEMWPPAAGYYKMIGLSAHTLGSGLAIRVALFDAANDIVQSMVMAPSDGEVQPNAEQTFRAVIREPSPIARRLEVTFTEEPALSAR